MRGTFIFMTSWFFQLDCNVSNANKNPCSSSTITCSSVHMCTGGPCVIWPVLPSFRGFVNQTLSQKKHKTTLCEKSQDYIIIIDMHGDLIDLRQKLSQRTMQYDTLSSLARPIVLCVFQAPEREEPPCFQSLVSLKASLQLESHGDPVLSSQQVSISSSRVLRSWGLHDVPLCTAAGGGR